MRKFLLCLRFLSTYSFLHKLQLFVTLIIICILRVNAIYSLESRRHIVLSYFLRFAVNVCVFIYISIWGKTMANYPKNLSRMKCARAIPVK